jgi:hypothetical protein
VHDLIAMCTVTDDNNYLQMTSNVAQAHMFHLLWRHELILTMMNHSLPTDMMIMPPPFTRVFDSQALISSTHVIVNDIIPSSEVFQMGSFHAKLDFGSSKRLNEVHISYGITHFVNNIAVSTPGLYLLLLPCHIMVMYIVIIQM